MSSSPTIPVVTIKLNSSKSSSLRDEDDTLSICSESSSSDSNYNFKNRYSSLSNHNDEEETTLIRLNRRSYSSLSQYNGGSNYSVRVNMNRSSPIYEEKSEDCQSDNEVTATYKLNSTKKRPAGENGRVFLRKSSTVIQCVEVKDDEDESEESSVSFSFKPPSRKKADEPLTNGDCAKHNGELNGELNGKLTEPSGLENGEPNEEEARKQFFIGKYKDIDEMLGNLFRMIEDTNQTLNAEELMEDFYEIEASAVKVHDNKALNAKVEEYREEFDSSAVRIRENRLFSTKLQEIREEIDKDAVQVKQNRPIRGELVKNKLEDCTFQLYKCQNPAKNKVEADYYGNYLDLESTIDELQEEFEGFHTNRKNAILLRTQLSVRVHTIIEKLLNSSGRELRRALFSLKQIFQVDKDLVHEFVQNDGLACLVKVGCEADQNHQNYILRALGQVMLYVDGMNGVIQHNETIQWLYSLISSKHRLVVKTALKLLLVFVEYKEPNAKHNTNLSAKNAKHLIGAINLVDSERDVKPWYNLVCLLNEKELNDMELLILAMSLINATLANLDDQDSFYDVVDSLEEQGMERIIQHYMSKQGIENDLLKQMHIYEAVLKFEDGEFEDENIETLDQNVRKIINHKKAQNQSKGYLNGIKNGNAIERRKSKRHALNCSFSRQNTKKVLIDFLPSWQKSVNQTTEQFSKRSLLNLSRIERDLKMSTKMNGSQQAGGQQTNGHTASPDGLGEQLDELTPGLRKRLNLRDLKEDSGSPTPPVKQIDNYNLKNQRSSITSCSSLSSNISSSSHNSSSSGAYSCSTEEAGKDLEHSPANNKSAALNDDEETNTPNTFAEKKSWMLSMMYGKNEDKKDDADFKSELNATGGKLNTSTPTKLSKNWAPMTTTAILATKEEISGSSIGVNKIKERIMNGDDAPVKKPVVPNYLRNVKQESLLSKESTEYLQWEQLKNSLNRPLLINDLDFTDLKMEDDNDICQLNLFNGSPDGRSTVNGIPGPPPLPIGVCPPPPPLPGLTGEPASATKLNSAFSSKSSLSSSNYNSNCSSSYSSAFGSLRSNLSTSSSKNSSIDSSYNSMKNGADKTDTLSKSKKTLKLFWKEVKEDKGLLSRLKRKKTIWDEIQNVQVDTAKLEHLFENRTKELSNKKSNEGKKNELILLDTKRSNAINIGMTKLPIKTAIKTAILKMDATIINREGIEKILSTMMPTEEEKNKITEAQNANPDIPLGNAEGFLLMLSSITALEARLKLWAFRLDYDIMEREIAEQLFDLKKAIEEIESSQTFKLILGTLRSIGNFLNGAEAKGFQIDYLAKVPEVKDTVHKHSLLYHLANIIIEKFPKSTDFYSEIGAVTRASKVDYDELARNITKLETDCKASWEYLKLIAKHDGNNQMKQKMTEFLRDSAERIIVLSVIHRRVLNRFKKMVVFLGANMAAAKEAKPRAVLQTISEFALEYRTTRERVKEQNEKKANFRERNKTRGKMITEAEKYTNRSTLSHHTSTPALNTIGNGFKATSTTSLSSTTHSNFMAPTSNGTPGNSLKSNELKADEQLRKILGKDTFETETDSKSSMAKWTNLNNVKRRPSVPVRMLSQGYGRAFGNNLNNVNGVNGVMADGDDEILENLVKNATNQNRLDNKRKTKSTKIDRKSFRRTLCKNDLNLTEEEKQILATMTNKS